MSSLSAQRALDLSGAMTIVSCGVMRTLRDAYTVCASLTTNYSLDFISTYTQHYPVITFFCVRFSLIQILEKNN